MRHKMDDGTVVDTDKASEVWLERTDHNGNNFISRATGTQWDHQTLCRSSKGRYYLEHTSQWQGSLPRAEWVTQEQAAAWIVLMERDDTMPEDLKNVLNAVTE